MKAQIKPSNIVFFLFIFLYCVGCTETEKGNNQETTGIKTETERFNEWMKLKFEKELAVNPELQSRIGLKEAQDKLTEISEKSDLERFSRKLNDLKEMHQFDTLTFDEKTHFSYKLYRYWLKQEIELEHFRHFSYPVNQIHGIQSELPAFMLNFHSINNEEDANAYIQRLRMFENKMNQLIDILDLRAEKGMTVPKFIFPYLYKVCEKVISKEKPLDENIFVVDFISKLKNLKIDYLKKISLTLSLKETIRIFVIPSYQHLFSHLKALEKKAPTEAGVWQFKEGQEYYAFSVKYFTGTNLTPEQIHQIGIHQVEKLQEEMNELKNKIGFKGTMNDFFHTLRTDEQFYIQENEEGKKEMLSRFRNILDSMSTQIIKLVPGAPHSDILVKTVESFRENSSAKVFYELGNEEGNRPGIFYVNLSLLHDIPLYEMEALAYHEGIPGHHLQESYKLELKELPEFRKYLFNLPSYSEGWALYAEQLSKELGFYKDPYSDFGRLLMELWRACRLVVDPGIHYFKWSREKAVQYLKDNTVYTDAACMRAVDRYTVMPGQAIAYTIGYLKIKELREKAQKELGEKFDIRYFHDLILKEGPIPLSMLEEKVNQWIIEKRREGRGE